MYILSRDWRLGENRELMTPGRQCLSRSHLETKNIGAYIIMTDISFMEFYLDKVAAYNYMQASMEFRPKDVLQRVCVQASMELEP